MVSCFAEVKIFRFWPKTMDYNKAFLPKSRCFSAVLLLHSGRCYRAEICVILFLFRCPFIWYPFLTKSNFSDCVTAFTIVPTSLSIVPLRHHYITASVSIVPLRHHLCFHSTITSPVCTVIHITITSPLHHHYITPPPPPPGMIPGFPR